VIITNTKKPLEKDSKFKLSPRKTGKLTPLRKASSSVNRLRASRKSRYSSSTLNTNFCH